MTTLRILASTNSMDEVKQFLSNSNIEYNDMFHALWDSVRYGLTDMVVLLLKDDRIRTIAADKENGCLLKAVEYGHVEIAKYLLDIPSVNRTRHTQRKSAYCMAMLRQNPVLMELLR